MVTKQKEFLQNLIDDQMYLKKCVLPQPDTCGFKTPTTKLPLEIPLDWKVCTNN